jgi:hypothetical protein
VPSVDSDEAGSYDAAFEGGAFRVLVIVHSGMDEVEIEVSAIY